MTTFVNCPECKERHPTNQVQFLNIEEDIHGRDLMTYPCPRTKNVTKALVFQMSYSEFGNDEWFGE